MAFRRKITFHSILLSNKSINSRTLLMTVFDKLQEVGKVDKSKLNIDLPSSDSLQFNIGNNISDKTVRVHCRARYIKYNDLPNTYRRSDGVERSLAEDNDENIGIPEETHFVIDVRYDSPIIAIETTGAGPKPHAVKTYLEHWCRKLEMDTEILIEPIIGRNLDDFMQVMSECASLELKVAKKNIADITQYEKSLGTILEASQNYGKTDFVKFIIGFNLNVADGHKPSTHPLMNKVRDLVRINKTNPNFFQNFDTIQVRAKENDEQLKIYDLIADRTAAEIFVNKSNSRSKYFDSKQMYDEIEKEIGRNFGNPPNP